ncbi:MAG: hypothetical protein ACK42C_07470 [Aquificaceae bacterium]|uniref:hypothetical protein n=1 Tax=Hydrogenobacter sp. Uz 6-8 TaxID=3384828 RepID=UPI0030B6D7AF
MISKGVTLEKIVEYAIEPDYIIQDPKYVNRQWRIKKVAGRCLKIVTESSDDILIVVTVFFLIEV